MQPFRRSVVVRAFAVLVASCCCLGPPLPVDAEEPAPRGELTWWRDADLDRAKLFDAVVGAIQNRFFDEAKLRELDWLSRAQAARASVISAPSTEDAVRQINSLISELKTSHTWLFTPDDYDYYAVLDIVGVIGNADFLSRRFWGSGPYYPGIGAFTREVDGRHFVDGILEGSPAEHAGLKYGDEILFVDGAPYSPIRAFRGKIDSTADLVVRRAAEAPPEHLAIPVVPIRPAAAFSAAIEASARVIEANGHRTGYVHIWASGESNSFNKALRSLEPSIGLVRRPGANDMSVVFNSDVLARLNMKPRQPLDSLIIDMRGRIGGNIGVAGQFLDQLTKPYWGNLQTTGRTGAAPVRNPSFGGRSALLIDHHTRSAAELMAYGYQRSRLGTVVGTPSAGAVSSGQLVVMPGDLLLYVAALGFDFDGHPLEGVGVMPDHVVERPLPYAAGADPVLDAAVELLTHATAP